MTGGTDSRRAPLVVLAAGTAVLVAATVALVVRSADPASSATTLVSPQDAVVVAADGSTTTAVDGAVVPRGALLRTGPSGTARLRTDGRDVFVGALSSVSVLDGVRQRLDRGQVMVDARRGPELTLGTEAGAVRTPRGGLARVERGPLLRVAVFDGRDTVTAAGRRATTSVPALHQVQVAYGGLPGRRTPLALRDDAWEVLLARSLVVADQALGRLADSLDGAAGAAVLRAAPAVFRTATDPAPQGEQALRVALAEAARVPGSADARLRTVQDDRDDGGSWGVVALLVRADLDAVSALLDGSLPAVPAGPVALAGGDPLAGLFGPTAGRPRTGGSAPVPQQPTVPTGPTSAPTPRPTRTPTGPVPTPLPSPAAGLVQTVVDTVVGLLHATPSPSSSPTATVPMATATLPPLAPLPTVSLGVTLP